ncbi:hypothetical protein [Chachezhania antarctica]|uniref:hypothetical protein n=1 Tax=Chachezhania antarctica TaxID=2340860 RepID=UPI000EAE77D6|nr:hypothetical protein [Chachezhania antarctica]|tara:strand:- start:1509 stop:2342 length:834 start_codon:yes stop_codon:yes gene_type:complete
MTDEGSASDRTGRALALPVLALCLASVVFAGCSPRRVVVATVSTAANATASAAGAAVNTAGAAVNTVGSAAGGAINAASGAAQGAAQGASAGAGAAGASTGTSGQVAAAATLAGSAAIIGTLDENMETLRQLNPSAQSLAQGIDTCLAGLNAGYNPAATLRSAGWHAIDETQARLAGTNVQGEIVQRNGVYGYIFPGNSCTFRTKSVVLSQAILMTDEILTARYPGQYTTGTPSGTADTCSGFTADLGNVRAWAHFAGESGSACSGPGASATIQLVP